MIKRGPFTLKWGDNNILDVEDISFSLDVSSDDYETIGGRTLTIDGAYKASVELTLLSTDIASLSLLFPQYFVGDGQVLSTGETVMDANGALDIKAASCDESIVYDSLDIISCGNPAQVTRLVNARSRISGIEVDSKIQKVKIMFIGETLDREGVVQMFKEGSIAVVS